MTSNSMIQDFVDAVKTTASTNVSMNIKTILISVTGVVLLTLALVFFWNLNRPSELDKYNEQFKAYQDTVVAPLIAYADSTKKQADSARVAADELNKQRRKLSNDNARLSATAASLASLNQKYLDSLKKSTLPPECDFCKAVVTSLETENVTLKKQVTVLRTDSTLAAGELQSTQLAGRLDRRRADSLQTVLLNFPTPPTPKKFLSFELNPRNTFKMGIVTGVIGTAAAVYVASQITR